MMSLTTKDFSINASDFLILGSLALIMVFGYEFKAGTLSLTKA